MRRLREKIKAHHSAEFDLLTSKYLGVVSTTELQPLPIYTPALLPVDSAFPSECPR